jgi:tellurium resistance protein TerZ
MAITLTKGQNIDLTKGEIPLSKVSLGLNWGSIEKKGFFGRSKESVDLDGSCAMFDNNRNILDIVYFNNLRSKDGSTVHSGDDLHGDNDGDDGVDNETISIDLSRIDKNVSQIVFMLNSFRGHDFSIIPFARIRVFENIENILAQYDIANSDEFAGSLSMVMGKIFKESGIWKFKAVGEATMDLKLQDTVATVRDRYL